MPYMVVLNLRIGLKTKMKIESPYENRPTLVETFRLAKKLNGCVLLFISNDNFHL